MKITAVNGSDRDWTKHRYIIGFGAYGWTVLMVWANSLEKAMEECVGWLEDNEPGHFCDDAVKEEYDRAISEGKSEEEAFEIASADTMCFENHHLLSWEVSVVAEDPTRDDILNLTGNPEKRRIKRIRKAKLTGRPFPKHKSSRVKLLTVYSSTDTV